MTNEIHRVFSAYFLPLVVFRLFFFFQQISFGHFYSVDDFLAIVRSQHPQPMLLPNDYLILIAMKP